MYSNCVGFNFVAVLTNQHTIRSEFRKIGFNNIDTFFFFLQLTPKRQNMLIDHHFITKSGQNL